MKKILLTQGKTAIVDDADFKALSGLAWRVKGSSKDEQYAVRHGLNSAGNDSPVYIHREIMRAREGQIVDHINGDGLDNRRSNLRFCRHIDNMRNGKLRKTNKSGYKGVSWSKSIKKWHARIRVNYKTERLGYYSNVLDAARAYNRAAKKYHGRFASLNQMPS